MIASMTGFGKGEAHCDNPACNVTAEITSVNRKQLEIRWNLPREFAAWEIDLRNVANKKLSRGAVSARVTMEFHGSGAANAVINQELLEKLIETADHVNAKYELNNSIDIIACKMTHDIDGIVHTKTLISLSSLAKVDLEKVFLS